MTNEQLSSVFNEGVQFNANQLQAGQGSGLGLYIAKGIVNLHGGRITAHSKGEGEGTEFVVELPLFARKDEMVMQLNAKPHSWFGLGCGGGGYAPITPGNCSNRPVGEGGRGRDNDNCSDGRVESEVTRIDSSSTYGGGVEEHAVIQSRRILIVDDSSTNRKLMKRVLTSRCGHTCVEAVDGQGNAYRLLNTYNHVHARAHAHTCTHM